MRSNYVAVALLAVVLTGCSAEPEASPTGTRTVVVSAMDAMSFDPAEFEFAAGETVRFEVKNVGELRHEFFIGDLAAQEEHAAEMAMDHAEPAGVTVDPGETATLRYTFAEAGHLFAACHEPGHYEAGMIAELNVN